ncbi:hypothetical protein JQ617_03360 [Bradyrhizobium sp. KB893862 SZCCT0404]|uniref:hypothetical protein n=1 Tax=Bradyrhizobium sp. KB893862 SZCCT0404 TaxID=2807672 RepID=UPI001BA45B8D|nr:hypothetical protein [Bradyrhizobium sp. KB893862 SZCCT0404]MBR1172983.1 hypothetical protein [Bradyrhizobium sp. KB893862 SZCCT0404]
MRDNITRSDWIDDDAAPLTSLTAQTVKAVIDIAAGEMPGAVAKAAVALAEYGATIFRQDDVLVRPITVEVAASDGRMTQAVRLKPIAVDSLLLWLADAADFRKWDKRAKDEATGKKGAWARCDPPRTLAKAILETPETWTFPTIAGVITCPTMRHDGSILCCNGYDPQTMLYLEIDPDLQMVEVRLKPTREEALAALARLAALLKEFPFKSGDGGVDHSVALAQIMTFAVRSALPISPAFLCRAPVPGSGKSYLNDLSNAVTSGRDKCPVISAGETIEETEKRIGAALLEGANVVAIDNCSHDLSGDALCQLTERPRMRIRVLRYSKMPEIDNRAVTTFNGNNIGPKGDMTRRTLLCNLDPKVERPELREFDHNPVAMVLAKRGAYLADIFTIIRAYIAAGRPDVVGPIASYERWSDMVRAPLVWLGCADPVASMDQARNEDEGLNAIGELFALWQHYLVVAVPFSAAEIVAKASERDARGDGFARGDFRDHLIQIAGQRGEISARNLGRWLRKIAGRVVGGLRLEIKESKQQDENHRAPKFILRKVRIETEEVAEMAVSQG